jgi:hypothetical protein
MLLNIVEVFEFLLKSDSNNGPLHKELHAFLRVSLELLAKYLSDQETFRTKVSDILGSIHFFSVILVFFELIKQAGVHAASSHNSRPVGLILIKCSYIGGPRPSAQHV